MAPQVSVEITNTYRFKRETFSKKVFLTSSFGILLIVTTILAFTAFWTILFSSSNCGDTWSTSGIMWDCAIFTGNRCVWLAFFLMHCCCRDGAMYPNSCLRLLFMCNEIVWFIVMAFFAPMVMVNSCGSGGVIATGWMVNTLLLLLTVTTIMSVVEFLTQWKTVVKHIPKEQMEAETRERY